MSGGVDSSLAAALLKEAGHEVVGITLHLWDEDETRLSESMCCSQEMTDSARRVAAQLGIGYYVFNYQREFRRRVIETFLDGYAQGYTPNPCLACNRDIKFRALLNRADALGFDYVATGHYARIAAREDGYTLLRGVNVDKDQSYMLYMLGQPELRRLMFPIGELSKTEVRELARARGLASADRPESQDICFVPGGDYRNLLREERPASLVPGPIVDAAGNTVGQHGGLPLYTVGQRRGLGVATGSAVYVTGHDLARNTLVVGPAETLRRATLRAHGVVYTPGAPVEPFVCSVQLRSHADAVAATVEPMAAGQALVRFTEPQRAVAPGQAVVFYDGDTVIGGGLIATFGAEQ